jgi:hypothetical protein
MQLLCLILLADVVGAYEFTHHEASAAHEEVHAQTMQGFLHAFMSGPVCALQQCGETW